MRTMFPTHDKNTKKRFQKPNILRKKSKMPTKPNTLEIYESFDTKSLVNTSCMEEVDDSDNLLDSIETQNSIMQSDLGLTVETELDDTSDDHTTNTSPTENSKLIFENNNDTLADMQTEGEDMKIQENSNAPLVNYESFFNECAGEKYMLFDVDFDHGKPIEALVVLDNMTPDGEMYIEQDQDVITSMVPLSEVSSQPQEINDEVNISSGFPNIYTPFPPTVKYKCDVPNCTKEFRSEQKYKKHKNSHDKDGNIKAPRQVTIECPVKQIEPDGTEKSCGKIFLVREQLLKHLNEEHTLDDAVYSCEECGRRFFWAVGLRAHVRAHCRRAERAGAGAGLVCAWPGCGRVFRQPCRLREHARAHTGDRPYPCQYPNCGWSFRSASKLVRHARRHTGERRHACAACGRAFLRREHLRDHHARHHAPHARRPQPCTHPGCEQTFNNMSTLYLHMKKVHKKKEDIVPATTTTDALYTVSNTVPDNTFTVSLSGAGAGEGQSARTHCTWPLERGAQPARVADTPAELPVDIQPEADIQPDTVLKDDDQVDQSEGSESNTFTVRSDLFLHGNVLINEDSEHMGVGAGDSLAADLGLLDAHPTIDLMQEELMYDDTAGDESSFRIFFLSGEEVDLINA